MGFLDYAEFIRQERERTLGQIIMRELVVGLWPFNLGTVSFFVDYDIDYGLMRLFVRSTTLPHDEVKVIFDRDDLLDYPEGAAEMIGRSAAAFFKTLQDQPVPNNVQLGEN